MKSAWFTFTVTVLFSFLRFKPVMSNSQMNASNNTCNSYEAESLNESNQPCVYNDYQGLPIIGIGFNLERSDTPEKMSDIGANHTLVRSGRACLSKHQVKELFENVMQELVACASTWLSNVWTELDEQRQSAIADMAFSMGCARLKTFKKMKAALLRGDYDTAEKEMRDSRWCRQVGTRCERASRCMLHKAE